jgi:hypothetical protein
MGHLADAADLTTLLPCARWEPATKWVGAENLILQDWAPGMRGASGATGYREQREVRDLSREAGSPTVRVPQRR